MLPPDQGGSGATLNAPSGRMNSTLPRDHRASSAHGYDARTRTQFAEPIAPFPHVPFGTMGPGTLRSMICTYRYWHAQRRAPQQLQNDVHK
jgi:hypothetical protein